jgi:hypothetical protein
MTDHAHRAPFRSTAWTTVEDALAEFLMTPCSPPQDLFFGNGEWTNEGVIVHQLGAQGINACDSAVFDAIRLKYESHAIETFTEAFRLLAAACGRDWAAFDLECLRECCESFRAFELPAWVHDAKDRDPETFLVNEKPALFMSADMTWCTPKAVLDQVRRMDQIGLDPCSNPRSIVRAKTEWTGPPKVNGLAEFWGGHGLVYVNPPYGRALGIWMRKCALSALAGVEIVACVPARPDTRWWHDSIVTSGATVCFWRGRIKFLGAKQGAPFPTAIVYYGDRPEQFSKIFNDNGWVVS